MTRLTVLGGVARKTAALSFGRGDLGVSLQESHRVRHGLALMTVLTERGRDMAGTARSAVRLRRAPVRRAEVRRMRHDDAVALHARGRLMTRRTQLEVAHPVRRAPGRPVGDLERAACEPLALGPVVVAGVALAGGRLPSMTRDTPLHGQLVDRPRGLSMTARGVAPRARRGRTGACRMLHLEARIRSNDRGTKDLPMAVEARTGAHARRGPIGNGPARQSRGIHARELLHLEGRVVPPSGLKVASVAAHGRVRRVIGPNRQRAVARPARGGARTGSHDAREHQQRDRYDHGHDERSSCATRCRGQACATLHESWECRAHQGERVPEPCGPNLWV